MFGSLLEQCTVGLNPQHGLLGSEILLYEVCADAPYTRRELNKHRTKYMGYFHSFGLSSAHAVLPLQHFEVSVTKMMQGGGTIAGAVVPQDIGKDTQVSVPVGPGDTLSLNLSLWCA